jgi:molybdopterin synthase catalytic subunit
MRILICESAFEPQPELAAFESANRQSGAVATFVGRCRAKSGGSAVHALRLQHYPGFTETEIANFATTLIPRFDLHDVLVIHRVGDIAPGEAIVLAATASTHRAEAFEGVQALVDFLKTDAPLWKQEVSEAGAAWIEPTLRDYERSKALKT